MYKKKEDPNNKTLYVLKTHIHAWLVSAGLPMRTPEHRSSSPGYKSSQGPGKPAFQPKNFGLWNENKKENKPHQVEDNGKSLMLSTQAQLRWTLTDC